jgi:hypothetical protein
LWACDVHRRWNVAFFYDPLIYGERARISLAFIGKTEAEGIKTWR